MSNTIHQYTALKWLLALVILLAGWIFAGNVLADETACDIISSDGYPTGVLTDDDYMTTDYYMEGTTLTITAEEAMDSLYIKWETLPGAYKLRVNGQEYEYGTHNYLHEYVKLPAPAAEVELVIPQDYVYIADIYAFTAGALPDWVQTWEDPYDETDILIFSAHSDDEILFMGSVVPTYIDRGCRVQVAYYCDLSLTESYRQHELLDGIWTMGVTHYPQLGEFMDLYSEDLETARAQESDLDASLEYVVRTIRRFKPLVLITHDLEGEYGHGQHRLLADLVTQAVELTANAEQYPQSAQTYGTWDVPKTYLHLYGEEQITIDDTVPLSHFNGRTAFEICRDAYTKHESQSWMWFFVGDENSIYENPESSKYGQTYEYPFNRFGLYRTLVGPDTGNDVMENVTSREEQARLEAEAESLAAQQAEQESIAAEEAAAKAKAEAESIAAAEAAARAASQRTLIWIIIIVAVIVLIFLALFLKVRADRKRREQARRLAARKKRAAQQSGSRTGSSRK